MLETIAGVPGMIGAMSRHFHSLRKLTRDNGWIHTLLGESLWTNQTVTVRKMTVASDLFQSTTRKHTAQINGNVI